MNKRLLLITFITLMAFSCFAQKPNDKNVLSFSTGLSIPLGDYAATSPTNNQSGYAKAGEHLSLQFEHKLNSKFGIIAELYGQRNGINNTLLAQQFSQVKFYQPVFYNPSEPPPAPQYVTYPNFKVDKHSWYTGAVLVGAEIHIPLATTNKLFFTAKAAIGAAYVSAPKLNASSITDTAAAFITQGSASAFGFAYMAGAGAEYKLTKKLGLAFGIDYFGTQVTFKNTTETVVQLYGFNIPNLPIPSNANAISVGKTTADQKQPVAALNVHAGITLVL